MDTWHNLAWSGEEWKQHVKEEIHNTEELGDCLRTSTWTEGSWLQPGTALARAFKGILTGRPLCHRGANFLRGLQLHQGYCGQKDFSTWAGVRRSPEELQAGQVDLNKTTTPYFLHNMTYSEEDFDRLLQLNDYNLRNSRDTVLQALRMALKRRAPEAGPSGAPRP